MNWWKRAYPEEPIDDPYQNEMFVDKFKKTFIENVKNIPKKLNIDKNSDFVFLHFAARRFWLHGTRRIPAR
jgi:hypothetical protein